MLPHPGPGSKRVPPPQSLPQLINNRVIVVEGWPRLQDQCGRDVGRGNSNLGAPTAWVKAHRSQSHFKVTQVPKSLLSATTAAVPWSPASKCSALGLNASSSSLAIPPHPIPQALSRMGTRKGCLGSVGLRESVAFCQEEEGETEVKSRACVLSPGTFQTFQDVGASWGKGKAHR